MHINIRFITLKINKVALNIAVIYLRSTDTEVKVLSAPEITLDAVKHQEKRTVS